MDRTGTRTSDPQPGPDPAPRGGAVTWLGSFGTVVRQPELRRLLPAMLLSALGDGLSLVAVAWLAVQIAPPGQAGVWTGLAVAAYALPATIGAAVLGRFVRGFGGAGLVAVDASLRAVALGAIAALAVPGILGPTGYVVLLALSSLLHAWGEAGRYTLVAELLPADDQVAGNAVLSAFTQAGIVVGPALAGGLTTLVGAGWAIGADALSFAVLAASCWLLLARRGGARTKAAPAAVARGSGWQTILGQPRLLGLVGLTCAFFFLYGPVEVALPIHVSQELHSTAGLLGAYWAVFGVGAVIGGLAAGLLRRHPLWPVIVIIVIGWGAALLPVGLFDAVPPGLVGFAVGGLIYGPFTAISTALFQRASPSALLSRVLATRTALTTPSVALGSLLGGPVVGVIGGQRTLLASALLTIALGVVTAAVLTLSRRRVRPQLGRADQRVGRRTRRRRRDDLRQSVRSIARSGPLIPDAQLPLRVARRSCSA